jgi:acetyl-CoA carboxylase beta subunit
MVFVKEWEDNLNVCPRCDHHDRIGATERFAQLFDGGVHDMIAAPAAPEDPLKFRDTKKYVDRIKAARAQTGDRDAYQNAFGRISGQGVVIGVQDFAFMGGSMGVAVGEAFVAGVEQAIKRGCPYIAVTAAGGARMQEGTLSLMQMPRRPSLCGAAHRSHDRRRHRELCDARRHPDQRAQGADWLRGPARDREYDPRKITRRLPARRISARSWDDRHGGAS